jgi:hypothetical protein
LFAVPGSTILIFPTIAPRATKPAVVTHALAVFPSVAFTTIFSLFALPPFMRGGLKVTLPFQTPPDGLHVTVPGKIG